jgi:cytochrome c biogenesis protein CcmG/thiol:disulfide interchange protein DsbE
MTRSRLVILVLVLLALGGSLAYGLRDGPAPKTVAEDLRPLQRQAGLDPCPSGISADLPDLELPCLGGGEPVKLRATGTGKPTLVNVYGSWCGPCLEEMPALRRLHEQAGGRLALVGVDTEDPARSALEFAIDVRQTWPAVVDDDGLVSRHFGGGAPKMIFVDARGAVVHVERKAYTSLDELKADVKAYLGVAV